MDLRNYWKKRRLEETEEQRKIRLEKDRERKKNKRSQETDEDKRRRYEKRRKEETEEEKKRRLEDTKLRNKIRISEETEEEKQKRLHKQRTYEEKRRNEETEEEKKRRLEDTKLRNKIRISEETEEEKQKRLHKQRTYEEKRRNEETEEEKKRRLEDTKLRNKIRISEETEEEKQKRLHKQRTYEEKRRNEETEEEKKRRLEDMKKREKSKREKIIRSYQVRRFPEMKGIAKNPNFRNYLQNNIYKGRMTHKCPNCKALYFAEENLNCCRKVREERFTLPELRRINPYLEELLRGTNEVSVQFRNNIRTYNSRLSFISIGYTKDNRFSNNRPYNYSFSISGQLFHRIPPIQPTNGYPETFQIYFHQNEEQTEHRMARFINDHIEAEIMGRLTELINEKNPLVHQFKTARQRIPENTTENYKIRLIAKPGQGSLPTAQEVSVLLPEEIAPERDVVVELHGGQFQHFKQNHRLYMPLAYPLMFLEGEEGWTSDSIPGREELTPAKYYRYRLHIREEDNILFHFGRLFQQYCVDAFVIVEQARLNFLRFNQDKLRTELYQGVKDAIEEGEDLNSIGRKFILPSSFTNGPRYMQEKFQDAMAIVGKYGKPHLFLTYTFNPNCQEITENLMPGQTAFDRPDLVTRIFDLKKKDLKKMIKDDHIFGKVKAYVDVIEFQKRGIPHMHMLIILEDEDVPRTPEDIDRLISAEIPDPTTHPEAYETVTKMMIHGPCNENSSCQVEKDGRKYCSKGFPKNIAEETSTNEDGYPVYRRRHLRTIEKNGRTLEDPEKWIVPYNPFLASVFRSHINLEVCSSVRAIKYLYKYVYKGHDQASIAIVDRNDEIKMHQDTRYVSAIEGTYRLFEKELNTNEPAVYHLQIHEENRQNVVFNPDGTTSERSISERNQETTLTSWMKYNQEHQEDDPECKTLTYPAFVDKYAYIEGSRKWRKRKNTQRFPTIGRIFGVSPQQKEKYFLRLLLFHIPGAKSFQDLRTVNNVVCPTYQDAALQLGLVHEDEEWKKCLQEASLVKMPRQFRQLFVVILIFCSPQSPDELWTQFENDFIEDFTLRYSTRERSIQKALQEIDSLLSIHSKQLSDFPCLPQLDPFEEFPEDELEEYMNEPRIIRDELFSTEERRRKEDECVSMRNQMNEQQELIIQNIISSSENSQNTTNIFFIDGPGGTGKTFIYNYLLKYFRSKNEIAIAVASSGIAATLLENGRTAHSRFGIPLAILPDSTSHISAQSDQAKLLRKSKIIIWDEAPMMKKSAFECVDRLLQDLMKNDKLFGGKIVVFGGDWRQVLPVIIRGSPRDIIDNCLKKSYIWPNLKIFKLTENIRIRNDPQAEVFSRTLLQIGERKYNDRVKVGQEEKIKLPSEICQPLESFDEFIEEIVRNNSLENWTILTPKNEHVEEINNKVLQKLDGTSFVFYSSDSVQEEEYRRLFQTEYLNTLKTGGMPPHKLIIKKNSRVILLRNLNPSLGLCNGTQLKVIDYKNNLIIAEKLNGSNIGEQVFIPRIPMTTADSGLPFTLLRRQYPIRQSYSLSINKAQGQTLPNVAIYLKDDCFTHGQLYVAMSRVKAKNSLKIFLKPNRRRYLTKNIVFEEIIND